jgi:hypothetical protein
MSRGLGKLQRDVLAVIVSYDAWFYGEYVREGEPVEKAPWLTWRIVRNLYFQERGWDFSPIGRYVNARRERSMKRALKTLVDRGSVCRVKFPFGWHYMTPETAAQCEAAAMKSLADEHRAIGDN